MRLLLLCSLMACASPTLQPKVQTYFVDFPGSRLKASLPIHDRELAACVLPEEGEQMIPGTDICVVFFHRDYVRIKEYLSELEERASSCRE